MLLQAYDFAHLYRTMGVELQMGGADQWGNITAGLELIRRTSGVGEDGRAAGPRPRLQAAAVAVGHEVRQERGRRLGLARSRADVAVRVLPVLAEHRRPRRRHVPALVHRAPARARSRRSRPSSRRARRRARRSGRWRCDITTRTHGTDAAARAIADSAAESSSSGRSAGPDEFAALALRVAGRVHVRDLEPRAGGARTCSPRRRLRVERRGAEAGLAGRPLHQRRAHHRPECAAPGAPPRSLLGHPNGQEEHADPRARLTSSCP